MGVSSVARAHQPEPPPPGNLPAVHPIALPVAARPRLPSTAVKLSPPRPPPACNYPHLSTPNQCLAGFVQIVSLCAELFEGSPRQATLSGSNIDRSRNYNGPCGWSEMWVIASADFTPRPCSGYTGDEQL